MLSPLGAGLVVEISGDANQAAVLLMPDGASRNNLRFLDIFRQQALKNAKLWYAFVKGLGSTVENGELYLVTGVDKSSSWMVGAAENQSQDRNISLKLTVNPIGSAGGSYACQWETSNAFADFGPRRPPGEDPSTKNQTVFLRGFRIALHSVAWTKISQAIPVVDSKRLTFFSKAWFKSFVQSQQPGSISRSPNTGQTNAQPEESDSVECFPATTRPYHPADAINDYLLESLHGPKNMVAAVTHDDEWMLAMGEESTVPSKDELILRIRERCTKDFGYGGIFLRETTAESQGYTLPTLPHLEIGAFSTILWFYMNNSLLLFMLLIVSSLVHGPPENWFDVCLRISFSLSLHAAFAQRPVTEVNRLSDAIKATEEMLIIAKPMRLFARASSVELVEMAKVKIWECKMWRQRLETSNAAEWWIYSRRVREFMREVDEGKKAVELVRRDTQRVIDYEGIRLRPTIGPTWTHRWA